MYWHTKNQKWENVLPFNCVIGLFLWRQDENILNIFALILPLFSVISWLLHYHNTWHFKIEYFLAHLWSNLSIGFEIKLIPCFLPPHPTANRDLVVDKPKVTGFSLIIFFYNSVFITMEWLLVQYCEYSNWKHCNVIFAGKLS